MSQDATEQSLERRLLANEIRVSGSERLSDVAQARNYLRAQATEVRPKGDVETQPPVTEQPVIAPRTAEPVTIEASPTTVETIVDPTDVDAIRAQVAILSDTPNAQNARDEYGIFS